MAQIQNNLVFNIMTRVVLFEKHTLMDTFRFILKHNLEYTDSKKLEIVNYLIVLSKSMNNQKQFNI